MKPVVLATAVALGALALGCSTGEGEGWVKSQGNLFVKDCWDGPFNLQPTFFASDPFEDTQQIRVQRGGRIIEESDGVSLVVNDVSKIRASQLGQDIPLGLPVGVNPPGFPPRVEPNPQVSLTLYLYDTCHQQNGALYSVAGSINFTSLFSGNRNENSAHDRLTTATFTATVADPRDAQLVTDPSTGATTVDYSTAHPSTIQGFFSFYFQRGIPAQPFP